MTTPANEDFRDRLTRVETKLDIVLVEIRNAHADHEARIRLLEARIGRWQGGIAVVSLFLGGIAGTLVTIISTFVR